MTRNVYLVFNLPPATQQHDDLEEEYEKERAALEAKYEKLYGVEGGAGWRGLGGEGRGGGGRGV